MSKRQKIYKDSDASKKMEQLLEKVVAGFLADPNFPEVGIHHARLLSLGLSLPEVTRLIGMPLLCHMYSARMANAEIDVVKLRFELMKLPEFDLRGDGHFLNLNDFVYQ